jgi:hypothetical protein
MAQGGSKTKTKGAPKRPSPSRVPRPKSTERDAFHHFLRALARDLARADHAAADRPEPTP